MLTICLRKKGVSRKWMYFLERELFLLFEFSYISSVYELSHIVHTKGFSPVWVLLSIVRLPSSEKELSQIMQPKGLSPVWVYYVFSGYQPQRRIFHFYSVSLYIAGKRFLFCVISSVYQLHIHCRQRVSLMYEFHYVFSGYQHQRRIFHSI